MPVAGVRELLERAQVRRDVDALRGQPLVVVVGVGVALAAVAQQGDHDAGLAGRRASRRSGAARPTGGAGRAADRPAGHARSTSASAAIEAASGTAIIRSTTDGRNDGSTRGRPMPSIREPRRRWRVAVAARASRRRTPSSPGRRRTAGCRAGGSGRSGRWSPTCRRCRRRRRSSVGTGMPLQRQLLEDRLGDVVVAAPVGGPLGVGELVEVVPAGLVGQPPRLVVDRRRVVDQVAAAALELDQRDLLRRRRRAASPRRTAARAAGRSRPRRPRSSPRTPR